MSAPPTRIINIDNFIFPQPCHNTIINITQCNTRYNIKNTNKSTKSYVLQTNLIYKTLSSNLKEISFTTYQKYRSLTTTVFFYCLYTKTNTDPSRLSDVLVPPYRNNLPMYYTHQHRRYYTYYAVFSLRMYREVKVR